MSARSGAAVAAAVFVAWAAFAVRDTDEVKLRSGQTYKGMIVSDTFKGMKMRLIPQGTVEVSLQEIAGVIYADTPLEYRSAKAFIENRNYVAALQRYLMPALEKCRNKLLRQYILYDIAFCYEQMGQTNDAIKAYQQLLEEVPETRFLPKAAERVVLVHISRREYDQALALIKKLKKLGPKWELKARLLEGLVFVAKKRFTAADKLFRVIHEECGGEEDAAAAEALVGRAIAHIGMKRYEQAANYARKAVREAKGEERVAGEAYVALGDAYFGMARGAGASVLDDALFAYLHVPVLYGGRQESEAKALYQAGLCFRYKNQGARAAVMFNMLLDKYSTSKWGRKARKELEP